MRKENTKKDFINRLKTIIGVCVLAVFFFLLFLPKIKKLFIRPQTQDKKILLEQLKPFIQPIVNKSKLPTITPSIYLKKGEEAYLKEYLTLSEPKTQTINMRARFAITKNVRIGATLPKYIDFTTKIDEGNLILTNKRIIFNATKTTLSVNLNEIISVDIFQEGISISKEKRKKDYLFSTKQPWLWKTLIHYLKTATLLEEIKSLYQENK